MSLLITSFENRSSGNGYLSFKGKRAIRKPLQNIDAFPVEYLPYLEEVESKDKSLAKKLRKIFVLKNSVSNEKDKERYLFELNRLSRLIAKKIQKIINEKILPFAKEQNNNMDRDFEKKLCKIIDENKLDSAHKELNAFRTFLFKLNLGLLNSFYSRFKHIIKNNDIDLTNTLWNATIRYQPQNKTDFALYAFIAFKHSLNRYDEGSRIVSVPDYILKAYRNIKSEIAENNKDISEDILEEKTINAMAKKCRVAPDIVASWITTYNVPPKSLNADTEQAASLLERLPDPSYKHPSELTDKNILQDIITPKIEAFIKNKRGKFKKHERVIKMFRMRYLEDKSFEEIAKSLGNNESKQNIEATLKRLSHDIRKTPALVRLLKELI